MSASHISHSGYSCVNELQTACFSRRWCVALVYITKWFLEEGERKHSAVKKNEKGETLTPFISACIWINWIWSGCESQIAGKLQKLLDPGSNMTLGWCDCSDEAYSPLKSLQPCLQLYVGRYLIIKYWTHQDFDLVIMQDERSEDQGPWMSWMCFYCGGSVASWFRPNSMLQWKHRFFYSFEWTYCVVCVMVCQTAEVEPFRPINLMIRPVNLPC